MPATSTGSASATGLIPAQCSVPSAGEFVTGAGLKTAIDPMNDDIATLKKIVRAGQSLYANSAWYVDGLLAGLSATTVAADKAAGMPLPVHNGSTVTAVQVRLTPAAHVTLPDETPILSVARYVASTGALDTTWSVQDAPADAANYSITHTLSLTIAPSAETVDHSTYVYMLTLTGETGANKDDILIGPPKITIS